MDTNTSSSPSVIDQVVVIIVPFPAQGHLNQLLHLSRLISAYDIPIHFIGTTTHTRQAKIRVHGWDPSSDPNIHFHDFPTPPYPCPPPDPTTSIKFPAHLQPSFESSWKHLREPMAELMHALSPTAKRVIVIHDALMSSVIQDVVLVRNAEAYMFHSVSAFFVSLLFWEMSGRPFALEGPEFESLPTSSTEDGWTREFSDSIHCQLESRKFKSGELFDTSKVVESKYLDLLGREEISGGLKQWALGPFNPVAITPANNIKENPGERRDKCLEWLDKQAENSVLYVAFGTTITFTDEQIHEIANGLEESGQKFMWVLRDADKGNVFDGQVRRVELPEGYEERANGLVVRDWAPQLEILAHPSTGGFLSHCGWNSSMESISMGVPMVAWPMHSDQPVNAVLITRILKIGLVVEEWGNKHVLVSSSTLAKAVRRLMASDEGHEIRKRARELGSDVRRSVDEGGAMRIELDSFVAHIKR